MGFATAPVSVAAVNGVSRLATGISAVVNTTYSDTGPSIAPGTTAPIKIRVTGTMQVNRGTTAADAQAIGFIAVVDDLLAVAKVISSRYTVGGAGAGATTGVTCDVDDEILITPASASRTYKLMHKISAATSTLTIYGQDGSAVVGSQGDLKMWWEYQS